MYNCVCVCVCVCINRNRNTIAKILRTLVPARVNEYSKLFIFVCRNKKHFSVIKTVKSKTVRHGGNKCSILPIQRNFCISYAFCFSRKSSISQELNSS